MMRQYGLLDEGCCMISSVADSRDGNDIYAE
jgi:hypothetical protein